MTHIIQTPDVFEDVVDTEGPFSFSKGRQSRVFVRDSEERNNL